MIKKTVTRNCTHCSFTWVFLTFVHVVFKFVSCVLLLVLSCFVCVVILCVFVVLFFFTLDAGLLARSQCSEGPATGHLDTGFSWFPCV